MSIDKNTKVVFIDMDGTLITTLGRSPFPRGIFDMKYIKKTWEALKEWANDPTVPGSEKYIHIVTNQGGIQTGRGSKERFVISKLMFVSDALQEYIDRQGSLGIPVSYSYCAFNDPSCPLRKPGTGMLENFIEAQGLENVPKSQMIMIGDASGRPGDFSDSDLKCAENFGISYIDVDDL